MIAKLLSELRFKNKNKKIPENFEDSFYQIYILILIRNF